MDWLDTRHHLQAALLLGQQGWALGRQQGNSLLQVTVASELGRWDTTRHRLRVARQLVGQEGGVLGQSLTLKMGSSRLPLAWLVGVVLVQATWALQAGTLHHQQPQQEQQQQEEVCREQGL